MGINLTTAMMNRIKDIGKFDVLTGLYFGIDEYQEKRQEGSSKVGALGASIFDGIMPTMMGMPAYMAFEAITSAPEIARKGYKLYNSYNRQLSQLGRQNAFQSAQFSDTEQIHTMRQAGMAIAQRSRYNTQQAMLGNEAKYMQK